MIAMIVWCLYYPQIFREKPRCAANLRIILLFAGYREAGISARRQPKLVHNLWIGRAIILELGGFFAPAKKDRLEQSR